jgi:mannose-6-phosphate isomerase
MREERLRAVSIALGSDRCGPSRLQDGSLLADTLAAESEAWLGLDPEHVRQFGANPGLLVKLASAGPRPPVHFHPGRAFAPEASGLPYGKTEAWIIIEAEPGATVHAGFSRAIELAEVREWMRA